VAGGSLVIEKDLLLMSTVSDHGSTSRISHPKFQATSLGFDMGMLGHVLYDIQLLLR